MVSGSRTQGKGVTTTGRWQLEDGNQEKQNGLVARQVLCVFKGVGPSGTRAAVQRVANVDIVDGSAHTLRCVKTATSVTAVVYGRSFTNAKAAGSIANNQPVILGSKVAGDDVLQGVLDQVSISIG